ncbi:hypothetical protein CR513_39962, partial [Mucuna pruriens]
MNFSQLSRNPWTKPRRDSRTCFISSPAITSQGYINTTCGGTIKKKSPGEVRGSTPTSLEEDNMKAKLGIFIDLHPCNTRTKDRGKKKGGQACKI